METPASLPVVPLDYARPLEGGDPARRSAARWQVGTAALSGPCVAVCFAVLMWGHPGVVLHGAVYSAMIFAGWRAQRAMRTAGGMKGGEIVPQALAGVGVVLIAVAPVIWQAHERWSAGLGLWVGTAYALLSGTSYRHVAAHRTLAGWLTDAGANKGLGLAALGKIKAVYETVWLACCSLTAWGVAGNQEWVVVFAYAALFGCVGYGCIWVWMIVAHAMVARRLKPAVVRTNAH